MRCTVCPLMQILVEYNFGMGDRRLRWLKKFYLLKSFSTMLQLPYIQYFLWSKRKLAKHTIQSVHKNSSNFKRETKTEKFAGEWGCYSFHVFQQQSKVFLKKTNYSLQSNQKASKKLPRAYCLLFVHKMHCYVWLTCK